MGQLRVGNTIIVPGRMELGALECGTHRDSTPINIPFMAMNGVEGGPTLCLSSLVHGDEVPGFEVIRRVMREEVDPTKLRGVIVAVPVLNPLAARNLAYFTLEDGLNLFTVFPGRPDGQLTERVAHVAYQEILSKCDYHIDFHSCYSPSFEFTIVPSCENRVAFDEAVEMAEAFGWPIQLSSYPGSPGEALLNSGKPAIIPELVGTGFALASSIQKGVQGTLNVLIHLGMIEGELREQLDLPVNTGLFRKFVVRVSSGGVVNFTREVGEWVNKGEVIGVLYDVYGQELEKIQSPVDGYLRSLMHGERSLAHGASNQLAHSGQEVATFLAAADDGGS